MAGFRTHITTSCTLGVGYTGVGLYLGVPWEASLIAGGLCGVGGMLPDIDSDSGIPFRESMGFAAAIIPMMLLDRLRELGLNYEQIVLAAGSMYVFVRFGLAKLLAKYTVHRGMFHSLPAAFIFAGTAFLLYGSSNLQLRYFASLGVFLGVMSHLILDEIYSVDLMHARVKKSFGTALKLWGPSWWGNISTYGKLALIIMLILGEPMVTDRYGQLAPIALERERLRSDIAEVERRAEGELPHQILPPADEITPTEAEQNVPEIDRTIYDTARRLWRKFQE